VADEARAQLASKLPSVGFLVPGTPETHGQWFAELEHRLRELGWQDGSTIRLEYRWAAGSSDRAAEIAAEFVHLNVNVIATSATEPTMAANPIVFAGVADAVGSGIVADLARPSGNVTGISVLFTDLAGKRAWSSRVRCYRLCGALRF
jgi:ABC transporter substrate binding protein